MEAPQDTIWGPPAPSTTTLPPWPDAGRQSGRFDVTAPHLLWMLQLPFWRGCYGGRKARVVYVRGEGPNENNAVWILNVFADPPHGETEIVGQSSGLRSFIVRTPAITRYFQKRSSQRGAYPISPANRFPISLYPPDIVS